MREKNAVVIFLKDRVIRVDYSSSCWEARHPWFIWNKQEIISGILMLLVSTLSYRIVSFLRKKDVFHAQKFSFSLSLSFRTKKSLSDVQLCRWIQLRCVHVLLPEDTLRQVRTFVVHYMHRAVRIPSTIYINNTIIAVKDSKSGPGYSYTRTRLTCLLNGAYLVWIGFFSNILYLILLKCACALYKDTYVTIFIQFSWFHYDVMRMAQQKFLEIFKIQFKLFKIIATPCVKKWKYSWYIKTHNWWQLL